MQLESHSDLSQALGADTCDNPNGAWKPQGQTYYWVTSNKFDYDDAKDECERVTGGTLAEVLDRATLELFYNVLRGGSGEILPLKARMEYQILGFFISESKHWRFPFPVQ